VNWCEAGRAAPDPNKKGGRTVGRCALKSPLVGGALGTPKSPDLPLFAQNDLVGTTLIKERLLVDTGSGERSVLDGAQRM